MEQRGNDADSWTNKTRLIGNDYDGEITKTSETGPTQLEFISNNTLWTLSDELLCVWFSTATKKGKTPHKTRGGVRTQSPADFMKKCLEWWWRSTWHISSNGYSVCFDSWSILNIFFKNKRIGSHLYSAFFRKHSWWLMLMLHLIFSNILGTAQVIIVFSESLFFVFQYWESNLCNGARIVSLKRGSIAG